MVHTIDLVQLYIFHFLCVPFFVNIYVVFVYEHIIISKNVEEKLSQCFEILFKPSAF